ncbi:hypothetical protein LEMLEM_LOCUS7377 [Lemmus lemmus]
MEDQRLSRSPPGFWLQIRTAEAPSSYQILHRQMLLLFASLTKLRGAGLPGPRPAV